MSAIIFKTVITFLVVFGLCEMISGIVKFFFDNGRKNKDIFVFIHVRNQEENIEYIIRCTIFNYLHNYGGRTVPYIVIVDRGSTDKTETVSRKLSRDYEFVYYATEEEYNQFKNDVESV